MTAQAIAADNDLGVMIEAAPVDQPWQVQSFACVVELSRRGCFTWNEWADTFGAEIKAHPQTETESASDAYYRQLVTALEQILASRNLCDSADVDRRTDEWKRAHRNTPHGHPIVLEAAAGSHCVPKHNLEATGKPVAVSPRRS